MQNMLYSSNTSQVQFKVNISAYNFQCITSIKAKQFNFIFIITSKKLKNIFFSFAPSRCLQRLLLIFSSAQSQKKKNPLMKSEAVFSV